MRAFDNSIATLTTTRVLVFNSNPARQSVYLGNYGSGDCLVLFDDQAPGIYLIGPGGTLLINYTNPFYGKISAQAVSGNTSLSANEVSL